MIIVIPRVVIQTISFCTWYFCGPTAAIHIPMLTSSPCKTFLTLHSGLSALIDPQHSHLLAGTLPGRLSGYLHCWRATGRGHERPRSLSRRQTQGRLDWHTQAPATSQYDPLPSSAWNWVRMGDKSSSHPVCLTHHCLTEHSCFFHLKLTKECTEVKHKWTTTKSNT